MQETKDKIEANTKEQEAKVEQIEAENESGLFNAGSASAGPMLRTARKEKSMTVEDVSNELNLSNTVVDAIENDSWEHLPEATYVRGYIRSYARLLGLDPADVLMSFRYNNSEQNISLNSMPRKIEDRKLSFSVPRKIKVFVFIAAIVAGFIYLYNEQVVDLLESRIDQVTDQNTVSNNRIAESAVETVEATNLDIETINTNAETTVDDTVETTVQNEASEKATDESVAEEVKELLELEFNSTSWVDIRDQAGKKIVYKSFPPGEKTSVSATLPIYVFIGNADAVAMRYQGQVIDLQQYKEEVYAKFTLDK